MSYNTGGDLHKTKAYSPETNKPKCFAPAITQFRASNLIFAKTTLGMVQTVLKVLALRSVHNSQVTSIRREAIAFRLQRWERAIEVHHSSTLSNDAQVEASKSYRWSQSFTMFQTASLPPTMIFERLFRVFKQNWR